jgi:RNA polymerase sigma factor (sigma-70 family)
MTTACQAPANTLSDDALHDLVLRARSDSAALHDLIVCCQSFVDRLSRRYCERSADAEDVAQEVWLAVTLAISQIQQPEALHGWLKRITINAAIRSYKRTSRAIPWSEIPDCADPTDDHEAAVDHIHRREVRRTVRAAVSRLAEQEQVLINLLYADERPDYARTSRLIDRPIGSIGPTRQRVMTRLRGDPDIARLRKTEEAGARR